MAEPEERPIQYYAENDLVFVFEHDRDDDTVRSENLKSLLQDNQALDGLYGLIGDEVSPRMVFRRPDNVEGSLFRSYFFHNLVAGNDPGEVAARFYDRISAGLPPSAGVCLPIIAMSFCARLRLTG
jgi:hypothetical protein